MNSGPRGILINGLHQPVDWVVGSGYGHADVIGVCVYICVRVYVCVCTYAVRKTMLEFVNGRKPRLQT
jgi:hypothetical protein